jgi:hypothetical protein
MNNGQNVQSCCDRIIAWDYSILIVTESQAWHWPLLITCFASNNYRISSTIYVMWLFVIIRHHWWMIFPHLGTLCGHMIWEHCPSSRTLRINCKKKKPLFSLISGNFVNQSLETCMVGSFSEIICIWHCFECYNYSKH